MHWHRCPESEPTETTALQLRYQNPSALSCSESYLSRCNPPPSGPHFWGESPPIASHRRLKSATWNAGISVNTGSELYCAGGALRSPPGSASLSRSYGIADTDHHSDHPVWPCHCMITSGPPALRGAARTRKTRRSYSVTACLTVGRIRSESAGRRITGSTRPQAPVSQSVARAASTQCGAGSWRQNASPSLMLSGTLQQAEFRRGSAATVGGGL